MLLVALAMLALITAYWSIDLYKLWSDTVAAVESAPGIIESPTFSKRTVSTILIDTYSLPYIQEVVGGAIVTSQSAYFPALA